MPDIRSGWKTAPGKGDQVIVSDDVNQSVTYNVAGVRPPVSVA
jgi:hypothetical protein